MILCFDLGNIELLIQIVNPIVSLIPTISSTASITPNPGASKLILAFSWVMIIPFYISKIIVIKWDEVNWSGIKNIFSNILRINNMIFVLLFVALVTSILLITAIYLPFTKGYTYHRRLLYSLFCNFTLTASLWGMCIILIFSNLFILIKIMFYGVINKKF